MSRLSEVKVGAVVIAALIVLAVVGYFFLGPGRAGRTWPLEIVFEDARGLTGGEPVRMAGVQIGVVKEVSLSSNGKASVKVLIRDYVHLYKNYIFTISSGALVPERFVDVQPVFPAESAQELEPGAVVQGLEKPGLPELVTTGHAMLTRVEQAAASVNSLISNPAIEKSLENFEATSQEAARLMANLESLSREARPELAQAARQVAIASQEAQKAILYLSARIQRSSAPDEIEEAVSAAKVAAENAQEAAMSMKALISDPAWQNDFRTSLSNMRQMSENLRQASENVREASGEVKEGAPKIKSILGKADTLLTDVGQLRERLKPPQIEPEFNFLASPRASRSFTDTNFDLSFAGEKKRFLRLGVADVGELNQVNFQAGRHLGNRDLRYGLVRSKLGVGADFKTSGGSELSLDLFDPNRLRADLTAEYPLAGPEHGWGLIFGVRDAFGEDWGFVGGRFGK